MQNQSCIDFYLSPAAESSLAEELDSPYLDLCTPVDTQPATDSEKNCV